MVILGDGTISFWVAVMSRKILEKEMGILHLNCVVSLAHVFPASDHEIVFRGRPDQMRGGDRRGDGVGRHAAKNRHRIGWIGTRARVVWMGNRFPMERLSLLDISALEVRRETAGRDLNLIKLHCPRGGGQSTLAIRTEDFTGDGGVETNEDKMIRNDVYSPFPGNFFAPNRTLLPYQTAPEAHHLPSQSRQKAAMP
jgi:hypothetical protein